MAAPFAALVRKRNAKRESEKPRTNRAIRIAFVTVAVNGHEHVLRKILALVQRNAEASQCFPDVAKMRFEKLTKRPIKRVGQGRSVGGWHEVWRPLSEMLR